MRRIPVLLLVPTILHSQAPETRFADMFGGTRIVSSQLSADGRWIVATTARPDFERDLYTYTLWLVPTDGGSPDSVLSDRRTNRVTPRPADPQWSPDGTH